MTLDGGGAGYAEGSFEEGGGGNGKGQKRKAAEGSGEGTTTPTTRMFLEDGDEVILRGEAVTSKGIRLGFGECRGVVLPAILPNFPKRSRTFPNHPEVPCFE